MSRRSRAPPSSALCLRFLAVSSSPGLCVRTPASCQRAFAGARVSRGSHLHLLVLDGDAARSS
eukprot:9541761-Lingulodinium_polyedra.AAC.1